MSIEDVDEALRALLKARMDVELALARKQVALAAYALDSPVPKRRLAEHLREELLGRGWREVDLGHVGISQGAINALL